MKQWKVAFFLGTMFFHMQVLAGFDEGRKAFDSGDYSTALHEWKPLADSGNAAAQNKLGVMYEDGKGVSHDYKEAVKWYRKAADQGYAKGQINIGSMYINGQGLAQDYKEAMKWFRKAADQGDADAQNNIGVLYYNGLGVSQDRKEALKWYRKAADLGSADAQYTLGYMYEHGLAVIQDDKEAVKWYRKAADQGNAAAQKNLNIRQSLPQIDMEVVKSAQKSWDQKAEAQRVDAQRAEIQRAEAQRAESDAQRARDARQAVLPQTKTVGQKVCLTSPGTVDVSTGFAIYGQPQFRKEPRTFELSGITEKAAGDRILVRIGAIKSIKPNGGEASFLTEMRGDPTYQVNQVSWDEANKWMPCR